MVYRPESPITAVGVWDQGSRWRRASGFVDVERSLRVGLIIVIFAVMDWMISLQVNHPLAQDEDDGDRIAKTAFALADGKSGETAARALHRPAPWQILLSAQMCRYYLRTPNVGLSR